MWYAREVRGMRGYLRRVLNSRSKAKGLLFVLRKRKREGSTGEVLNTAYSSYVQTSGEERARGGDAGESRWASLCSRDSMLTRAKTQPGEKVSSELYRIRFYFVLPGPPESVGKTLNRCIGGVDWRRRCLSGDDVYCE